jgi:hypothetical protein
VVRIKIVGGDFGTRDHFSIFPGVLLFNPTVEELTIKLFPLRLGYKGDVGVFFGFGNVTLPNIVLAKPFSKDY